MNTKIDTIITAVGSVGILNVIPLADINNSINILSSVIVTGIAILKLLNIIKVPKKKK
jgi:hypothetical protein